MFNALEGWSVRQTGDGMELWDSGGLWAVGHGALGAKWLQAAEDLGHVLVVYGPRIGVRQPVSGRWDAAAKAAELRSARQSGIVAAAVVAWRGLQPPDVAPYPDPRYNPTTGEIDIGVNAGGESSTWRLLEPGVGVRHGLIVGPEGWGKTNTLRILNLGALTSKRFVLWAADPACRSDLTWMSDIADWIATGSQETVEMLRAAGNAVAARLVEGGYAEPFSAKPGILLTVDDGQQVFAGNPEATRLAEAIAADGGRAGVALVVTTRGADLAYFGGSAKLRAGLAAGVAMAMGPDAYGIHDMLRVDGGTD
ncbi:hypothetical protein ABH935_005735 [Catenulispora sp. GAS73]|uniref:hypothetical protein n=1 Tax=Catenulispora sp. GAS73 TaxID=3156269 RepID=UPI003514AE3F